MIDDPARRLKNQCNRQKFVVPWDGSLLVFAFLEFYSKSFSKRPFLKELRFSYCYYKGQGRIYRDVATYYLRAYDGDRVARMILDMRSIIRKNLVLN